CFDSLVVISLRRRLYFGVTLDGSQVSFQRLAKEHLALSAVLGFSLLISLKLGQFPLGQFEIRGFEAPSNLLAPYFEPCEYRARWPVTEKVLMPGRLPRGAFGFL